jgi:plastocyanin
MTQASMLSSRKVGLKRVGALVAVAVTILSVLSASAGLVENEVDQKGLHFSKDNAAISVGATMHFHNSDDVIHNIMTIDADDEPEDQGLQKPGQTISTKFDKAGTYQVRCAIHPKMKMTVTVGE